MPKRFLSAASGQSKPPNNVNKGDSKPAKLVTKSSDNKKKPFHGPKSRAKPTLKVPYTSELSEDETPKALPKVKQPSRTKATKAADDVDSVADSVPVLTENHGNNLKRRLLPATKPKRPSFTNIEESLAVDDIAAEVNEKADQVVAVVRRVPLPPASSDIERDESTRLKVAKKAKAELIQSRLTTKSACEKKGHLVETLDSVKPRTLSVNLRDSTSNITASLSTNFDLSSTLHSTLHENHSIAPKLRSKSASKQPSRSKRILEPDSEADPLDLFTC